MITRIMVFLTVSNVVEVILTVTFTLIFSHLQDQRTLSLVFHVTRSMNHSGTITGQEKGSLRHLIILEKKCLVCFFLLQTLQGTFIWVML